jgi:hypothetical protein
METSNYIYNHLIKISVFSTVNIFDKLIIEALNQLGKNPQLSNGKTIKYLSYTKVQFSM